MNKAILENLNEKGVLTLTLNRPDVLNAMNADLILGLLESINTVSYTHLTLPTILLV